MPLSAPRETVQYLEPVERVLPVEAGVRIFQGALVVFAAGLARPGRVATTDTAVGVAMAEANNIGGAASAISVQVRRGVFCFRNSTAGDLIARSDIGANCFIADDDLVAKTNGASTRSIAGRVYDVDARGVWVEIG
ncbi:MAG: hypothetical protein ACK5U4_20585 [Rhodospirillales bacterium]